MTVSNFIRSSNRIERFRVFFAGKVFQQTVGIRLGANCTHLLVDIFLYILKRSGTYTVSDISGRSSISVQFHVQVYRWCIIVHKEPRIFKTLSGRDVSCWTWNQRHDSEQSFSLLPRFTPVGREGKSTSHFHLWQTRLFQYFSSCVVILHLRQPMAFSSHSLYDMHRLAPHMTV